MASSYWRETLNFPNSLNCDIDWNRSQTIKQTHPSVLGGELSTQSHWEETTYENPS